MTSVEILAKIKELKLTQRKMKSNSFLNFSTAPGKEWNTLVSDRSLIILENEGGAERLYFYTIDFEDMKLLISKVKTSPLIEIVTKNQNDMIDEMKAMGYSLLMRQVRVANRDISRVFVSANPTLKYYDKHVGQYAVEADCPEIHSILWNTFDTRISHLPSEDEIVKKAAEGEFWIYRNKKGELDSLIQIQENSKSFYFNQIINKGDKNAFHALVLNLLEKYCKKGGKYAYAWVNEDNIASLKFFEKYGLTRDNVINLIYVKD